LEDPRVSLSVWTVKARLCGEFAARNISKNPPAKEIICPSFYRQRYSSRNVMRLPGRLESLPKIYQVYTLLDLRACRLWRLMIESYGPIRKIPGLLGGLSVFRLA
jgi:hypothetical protein